MSLRVLAIVGPTASGKSALALQVAAYLPIEIVSCDSQQVYAGMDIGTGKPHIAERRAVPHHLLDIVVPTEPFHAARWAALARVAIEHITARGRVPVVVGGTGLYFRALMSGLFEAPPSDRTIRERHREEAHAVGVEALHARLATFDPQTARRVQPRDLVRISRALEIYEQTGVPISELRTQQAGANGISASTLVLDPPLDQLRERIGRRFDDMIAAGFVDEVRTLRTRYGSDARALAALGYRQVAEHIDGLLTLDEAAAVAKAATSAYARRQRTWFRKEADAWRAETLPDAERVAAWWKETSGAGQRARFTADVIACAGWRRQNTHPMPQTAERMDSSTAAVLDFERPIVELERKIEGLVKVSREAPELRPQIDLLASRARELQREIFADLSPWQKVQLSRHPARPYTLDYIDRLVEGFVELHGDRRFGDDPAIVAGFAQFEGTPVLLVGQQKGRGTKEKVRRNFGQPKPEGYRKALRLMDLAARMRRPIICLIDTQGAYPGIDAEERGQAEAIAKNLEVMAGLPVPIVCAVIGEGGSGGALALGVGDRILMLEYATYSVISPEGCASILWRDDSKKPEAAAAMKMTSTDLKRLAIVDEIVAEPLGGAHRDHDLSANNLKDVIRRHLGELMLMSPEALRAQRYDKFRRIGAFVESGEG